MTAMEVVRNPIKARICDAKARIADSDCIFRTDISLSEQQALYQPSQETIQPTTFYPQNAHKLSIVSEHYPYTDRSCQQPDKVARPIL
jgi:hypothetical protein